MGKDGKLKIMMYSLLDYDIKEYERYKNEFDMTFLRHKLDRNTAVFSFDCDAVIACPMDEIGREVIDELLECGVKLLAMRSAGYNNVDLQYAKGRLPVVNVPDYSPYSIAEFAAALMLTVIRKTHKSYTRTREHNFSINNLTGFELYGKTVGIVGEGRIGSAAIAICKGFGMHVIVNTPHPRNAEGVEYVTLDELFERSDIIQLHCPLTAENRHLINDDTIRRMKDGVVIVNTARGGLIDTRALIRGLNAKKISAAGIDVYENEAGTFTVDYTNDILEDETLQILLGFPNVVVTAHQAYFTQDSLTALCDTTMQNIREFFESGSCRNLIGCAD